MKSKLVITGVALLGLGGAMHLGKMRICPLGLMVHHFKNTSAKPASQPAANTVVVAKTDAKTVAASPAR